MRTGNFVLGVALTVTANASPAGREEQPAGTQQETQQQSGEAALAAATRHRAARIPHGVSVVVVDEQNATFTFQRDKDPPELAPGTYRVRKWTLERNDQEGNLWTLTGHATGDGDRFEVREEQEASLRVGEPVHSALTVEKTGATYRFQQSLRGQLDERIEIAKNGKRPGAPKLRITNADASYDKAFALEYG